MFLIREIIKKKECNKYASILIVKRKYISLIFQIIFAPV